MNEITPLHVAIIGAGPSGYYAAEALTKANETAHIDIIDRLPTPYGLIRGGVAPDHQSIKGVVKRYEKASLHDNVRFVGNIEIGKDIRLQELLEIYDAVIIATGAPLDRPLGIPGDDKAGVIGSARFVGWYNSHPDFTDLDPDLEIEDVVVVGNGNVAVDVARVLAKTSGEMITSDLAPHASERIHPSPIKNIYMLGRRGPIEGKFTPKELGELGELERCVALAKIDQIPQEVEGIDDKEANVKRKNLAHLQSFTQNTAGEKAINLHVEFYAKPVEILGQDHVTGIKLERTKVEDGQCIGTAEFFELPCQMVVACIGYKSEPIEGAAFNEGWSCFDNDEGRISDRLYVVGWAKRGPSGTIGTNRPDAIAVVDKLLAETQPANREGGSALDRIIKDRHINAVSFDDWKQIEAAEEARAAELHADTPRVKFANVKDMLEAAGKK